MGAYNIFPIWADRCKLRTYIFNHVSIKQDIGFTEKNNMNLML